jgi:hypothetical protein
VGTSVLEKHVALVLKAVFYRMRHFGIGKIQNSATCCGHMQTTTGRGVKESGKERPHDENVNL